VTYAQVIAKAEAAGLLAMGALHPAKCAARQLDGGTLILLGAGAGFWPTYCASQEAQDKMPDPIDRWSSRVVGELARRYNARAIFPFGGPPYEPFIDWALKSGRAFTSPTGMMVHDTVGLMISYRGALHFTQELDIPTPLAPSPCDTCAARPCISACPVGALSRSAPYDLNTCHSYLDTRAGGLCMAQGCAARIACPISYGAARHPDQSALHMRSFHKT
jgi:ferredoxin